MEERPYKLERLVFRSQSRKLIGTLLIPAETKMLPPGVLILHGFPGVAPILYDLSASLCQEGFAPMLFHYRGCWGSGGRYSFLGVLKDAQEALEVLAHRKDVDASRLATVGHSFGGLAAIQTAAQNNSLKAVAALCPVASFKENITGSHSKTILARGLPFVSGLAMSDALKEWKAIVKHYDPIYCVNRISPRPFLLMHGDKDDIMPISCSTKLFSRAEEPKEIVVVNGADHIFSGKQKIVVGKTISWLKTAISLGQR
jgi:dipeptidyl aminopeptidase/acylaminoacyl peptidase